jgi:hypothetical protein
LAAPDVVSAQVWEPPAEIIFCVQKKPPGVFLHKIPEKQVCVFSAHSSTSEHAYPFPEKPGWQEQLKEPTVLTHDALAWQLWLFKMHSLRSEQEKLFPEKPDLQPHETESIELEQTAFPSNRNAFKV